MKKLGTAVIGILIIFFLIVGYRYISYRNANAVSDAAFIKSDRLAMLSFKVGGKVTLMTKNENDPVKKGDLLASIDPVDLLTAKEQAQHKLNAQLENIKALKLQRKRVKESLNLQSEISKSNIDAAKKQIASLNYQIKAKRIQLKKLKKDDVRYADMLKKHLIAQNDYERIHTQKNILANQIKSLTKKIGALNAELAKAQKGYELSKVAKQQIKEIDKQIASFEAAADALSAAIKDIDNKLSYTKLYAPFDGIIAKKFFTAPRVIKKGSAVYALSDPKALYCEVLLSEKKIHGIKPGNTAVITVDAFKDKTYKGKVESIAPTSASTFSLVPRDIASGEFTKLDQRFVVRIKLENIDKLRAGMGVTVAISRSR